MDKVEIRRMIESVNNDNPVTTNFGDVVLYDSAFKHKVPMEQILAHELSHPLYKTLTDNQREEFTFSAGWEKLGESNLWTTKVKKIFIESDSRASIEEDFANHIEHYLFKNDSLKKNSPEAHKWIQKTFVENFKLQEKK